MIKKIFNEIKTGKNLLKFGTFSFIGQALAMIAPLVAAKLLSPERFGSYSLAIMIMFLFVTFFIASFQTPFIVYANNERKNTGKINKSLSIQIVFLISSIILFVLLATSFQKQFSSFTGLSDNYIFVIVLAFCGISVKTFLNKLMLGLDKKIANALVDITYGSVFLVLIILLSITKILSLELIFTSYLISAVITFIVFIPSLRKKVLLPFDFDYKQAKEMLSHTKWIFLSGISIYLVNWGDNFVLKLYSSLEQIGIYNFSYQIFKALIMCINLIGTYFLPTLAANIKSNAKIQEFLFEKKSKILGVSFFLMIVLYIIISPAVLLFYGDKFSESIIVIRVLMIGAVFHLLSIFNTTLFSALKKFRVYQWINVFQVVVNLALDLLLIHPFGLVGLAIATATGYFVKYILIEIYFHLTVKKRLSGDLALDCSRNTRS